MTIAWPLSRQQVLDLNGKPRLDLRARFFVAGTTTPRPVYADSGLTEPLAQPVAPDAGGRFPRVYLGYGLYRERVSTAAGGDLWNDDGLGLPEPEDETETPTTPELPANAFAITGDVKWRLDSSIQVGWVRMNGGTIGNAASGASERSNADTVALYTYLWTTFAESVAPVTGGRGSTAAADFAAGKRIAVPSMRGVAAAGLEAMGTSSAGRIQTVATLTLTANSFSATVPSASAARLTPGLTIFAEGVNPGVTIVSISGTTITMSERALPGSTGAVQARFGLFDAELPGATGGDWLRTIANPNLPVVMPDGSVDVSYPAHTYSKTKVDNAGVSSGAGGTGVLVNQGVEDAQTTPPAVKPHTVETNNATGGRPLAHVPPIRVGTFYIKL